MNTIPIFQPVYSGLVVTLFCADTRTGRDYPCTVPDDPDKIKEAYARTERRGDRVIRQGVAREPMPHEVPLATAKSKEQEKAEKAAAKRISANRTGGPKAQKGGKRVERTEKRVVAAKPLAVKAPRTKARPCAELLTPTPPPGPIVKPAHNARAVVCLSTGVYYQSVKQAEDANNIKRTTLYENLKRNAGWGTCKGKVYDYATEPEQQAQRCLRQPPPTDKLINRYQGTRSKAFLVVATGEFYERLADLIADKHIGRQWLTNAKPDEVRETPIGKVMQLSARAALKYRKQP